MKGQINRIGNTVAVVLKHETGYYYATEKSVAQAFAKLQASITTR